MKKRYAVLVASLFIVSCEGPAGPRGPQGPQGYTGPSGPVGPVGQGFEVKANFDASNDYSKIFTIPEDIEVLRSDIVMVYLLWEVNAETGEDVWQPLPVSVFLDGGELQYGFDHTVADVRIFLTGDANLDLLGADITQKQIFRVAILPVDYVQKNKININSYGEVEEAIQGNKFKRIK